MKISEVKIRQEESKDYPDVFNLIEWAFSEDVNSDHNEQFLVNRLRKSTAFVPELSLVATYQGKVIGHILLTKIKIVNPITSFDSLALAPVSVLPNHQNNGIGGMLINEAHEKAKSLGHESIILLGHASYYPKFGYQRANHFGISLPFDVPKENCLAIELNQGALDGVSGMIEYPPEFFSRSE